MARLDPKLIQQGEESNVKVVTNNIDETNIITKKTLNSSLKKKGKLLFALFLFRTLFIKMYFLMTN